MDPYLALTPLLLLGIIGLIRFIGCNQIYGLDETTAIVEPVGDLVAVPADQRVTLSWSYPGSGDATGFRIDVAGGAFDPPPALDASARAADITGLTNGVLYTFSVFAERGTDASAPKTLSVAPGVTSYVIDQPALSGIERNNYGGWVGMEILVGSTPIVVTQLGRIIARANSGVHAVKIVSPATMPAGAPVDGIDRVSADVTTIAQSDQSNVGTFAWATLPQPFTLQPNTIYFIVSLEANGGDLWYEEQSLPTTSVAAIQFSSIVRLSLPDIGKYQRGQPGQGYVPVSFRY
jgi:hypothetical protein